jgi:pyridoxine 5-phosphate synthase
MGFRILEYESVFSFDYPEIETARDVGADRIELYTEPYAQSFSTTRSDAILDGFRQAAAKAQEAGLGVNAGHDLSLQNIRYFLDIPGILEVSIGHALIIESIYFGIEKVIGDYLEIIRSTQTTPT